MKKLTILILLLLSISTGFAADFSCSRDENKENNMYLGNSINKLTDKNDVLNCSAWLDKMTIKTLKGDDIINTIKSNHKGTKIELNDGNDKIIQDVEKGIMDNFIIDGGAGYDKLVLNVKKNRAVIDGKCNNNCKIYIKNKRGEKYRKFKNVELRNIDEIDFSDGKTVYGNSSENNNQNNDQNSSSNENNNGNSNNTNTYKKINLSSYKYLIPAYWWSYDFNKKLGNIQNTIAIINPSNGDFSKSEKIFVDEINKTHKNKNLAIGYIYTRYGKRSLQGVKNKIDSWLKNYPNINGFFFDEASSSSKYLDFYKNIYIYVKSKNENLVVILNPGTIPDKDYLDISDNIVIYENPCNSYSNYKLPTWINNYSKSKFSFLGYSCNKSNYDNLSNKYKNYIQYFTDDGQDGNPWNSFSKYLIENTNTSNTAKNNISNNIYPPYNFSKFHNILDISKLTYPDSHTKIVNYGKFINYKSDFFFANKDGNLHFILEKKANQTSKLRDELRQGINGKDYGWRISTKNIYKLNASIKLQKLEKVDEYTFLQIHSKVNPLVRVVVKKEKNGFKNHIWAVVRINTNDSGKRTNWYNLGQVSNAFYNFQIEAGNNNLKIIKNNKVYINKDISYWPETKNYFKAGIYDSHNSSGPFKIEILFKELVYSKTQIQDNENNQENSTTNYNSVAKYLSSFIVKNGKIYDKNRNEVKLYGVNWFGFETPNYTVHGLWSRNYLDMIKQMKKLGFNAVRLPFCPGTLHGKTPTGIDFAKNPNLKGLNSLQLFDKIINALTSNSMYVLLDHHRPDCNAISQTPEVPGYRLNDWINDLVFIAKRYKNNPYVIGIDLKNEPHGKERWGNGDIKTDWKLQVNKAAKAILQANNNLLIFVEGIETNHNPYTETGPKCESSKNHWWGGNIEPIECYPLDVPKNKLVLSPHIYGPSVYMQPYFKNPNFQNNMPKIWQQQIGRFIGSYLIVPGEFGGKYIGLDKIWQQALINWFIKKHICSFFFWSWNPNSGDTGGILKDDWTSLNTDKYKNLKRLMNYCSSGKDKIVDSKADNTNKNNVKNKTISSTWKEKIEKLNITFNTSHKYIKYEKIFIKFFNDKKNIILKKAKYQNEDSFNYLNSFIWYSNILFVDGENKNYENIKSYVEDFKKIIKKLKVL